MTSASQYRFREKYIIQLRTSEGVRKAEYALEVGLPEKDGSFINLPSDFPDFGKK